MIEDALRELGQRLISYLPWRIGGIPLYGDVWRTENGTCSVPVITLTKRERVIILIGMAHVALPEFFAQIRRRVQTCEDGGFKVLYESIDPAVLASSIGFYEGQRLSTDWKRHVAEFTDALEQFGMTYQSRQLPPRKGWVLADLSPHEWPQEAGAIIGLTRERMESTQSKANNARQIVKALSMAATAPRHHPVRVPMPSIVLSLRNRVAAKTALDQAQTHNVVMLYGTAHMPGISKILRGAGYRVKSTEWVSAFDLEPPKLKAERE